MSILVWNDWINHGHFRASLSDLIKSIGDRFLVWINFALGFQNSPLAFHLFISEILNNSTVEMLGYPWVIFCCHGDLKWCLVFLIRSWRRSLSYRNQSNDLRGKSMFWFLYDGGLCYEINKTVKTQTIAVVQKRRHNEI